MSRRRFFRFPFGKPQLAEDVRTELEHHLALTEEALMREGLSPAQARSEAARRFGNRTTVESDCLRQGERRRHRLEWRTWWIDLWQDLGYAVRSLRRDRSFTLIAVVILSLGLGATTALFSLYRGTVLRPLAADQSSRLAMIETADASGQGNGNTPAAWFEWRQHARTVSGLTFLSYITATLQEPGNPEQLDGIMLGDDAFQVLGVHAALGRGFLADDFAGAGDGVVLISDALWHRRFNRDAAVVGRSITLDGTVRTVVGVMPADPDVFGTPLDFWIPKSLPLSQRSNVGTRYLTIVGRLSPGATVAGAQRELNQLFDRVRPRSEPGSQDWQVRLTRLDRFYTSAFRDRLLLLLAATIAVLLIGCANVGNLLVARGSARHQELTVRTALGASRGRIVRQLLTENLVLGLIAAIGGVFTAQWTLHALLRILPSDILRLNTVRIDWQGVAFAVTLALLVALLVGLIPAVRAARADLRGVLGAGGRGAVRGAPGEAARRALIVAEVAMSTALLVGAGLLLRSAAALSRVPPGFVTDSVVTARMALPARDYPTGASVTAAYQRIYAALAAAPGQQSFGMVSQVPISDGGFGSRFHQLEHPMVGNDGVLSNIRVASPGYFGVMGMAFLAGRDISLSDATTAPPVVVVNETFVREIGWQGSPVGHFIHTETRDIGTRDGKEVAFEVVGVVKDVQEWGLRQAPSAMLYLPLAQAPDAPWDWSGRQMLVAARGVGDPMLLVPTIRTAIRTVDAGLPLFDIQTMGQRLRASLALERTNTIVITALGAVALLLAAVGIYGVLAYGVKQRAGEIGIRVALGAENRDIVRLVLGEGVRLAVIGLAIGLPIAIGVSRLLRSSLFGIGPADPASFLGSGLLLLGVTVLACLVPVRMALAVPPVEALRN